MNCHRSASSVLSAVRLGKHLECSGELQITDPLSCACRRAVLSSLLLFQMEGEQHLLKIFQQVDSRARGRL